jgi:hypothetical protein
MDTIYLANVYGPVAFHDGKGGYSHILDWRAVQAMVDTAAKKKKKRPVVVAVAKGKKAA